MKPLWHAIQKTWILSGKHKSNHIIYNLTILKWYGSKIYNFSVIACNIYIYITLAIFSKVGCAPGYHTTLPEHQAESQLHATESLWTNWHSINSWIWDHWLHHYINPFKSVWHSTKINILVLFTQTKEKKWKYNLETFHYV